MDTATRPDLDRLIGEQPDGYTLAQPFYCDEDVLRADIDRLLGRRWLLVDHVSRIPEQGDYSLFRIGGEEIVIVRENEERVNAFFNVCRHRGSRVCLEESGSRKVMTCPYHAWTYNLDGSLRAARLMAENFDKSAHGLHRCHVRVFHGLIFVCLTRDDPPDFDAEYGEFGETLAFQGIAGAKIAVKRDYPNEANWKLVVENFLECYHCGPAHPEYCSVHPADQLLALGAGPGSGPAEAMAKYQASWDAWKARAEALGHPTTEIDRDEHSFDMAQLSRLPINDRDFESETRDGSRACAKLLGDIAENDRGETAFVFNPVGYVLSMNDFALMARFTPRDAGNTDVQLSWLVHRDAVEGVDYDPDHLTFVWDRTIRQDKQITVDNQAGIRSSRYQPGPYSEHERRVATFIRWYLRSLAEA